MNRNAPFLAVPVRALVSGDGKLLEADPPLWRLHVLAGGESDGRLAIPGLVALATVTARTKIAVQRAIRVSDEEHDVELWVESRTAGNDVELLVTGWRDLAFTRRDDFREQGLDAAQGRKDSVLIDSDGRIISLPVTLANSVTGQSATAIFEPMSDDNFAASLASRETLVNVTVKLSGLDGLFILNLAPQHTDDGGFLGHAGTLRAAFAEPVASESEMTPMPMGRQFASVLKQPLSRIVANAETIGSRLRGPLRDNYAEYALDIANAARHLTELVSDMEDLEAIDRPGFVVARDRIELGDIARRVAGLLALKASDHGMVIKLPHVNERVEAIGEFRRVLQIMLNLVGNAIRYAPDGSMVSIQIETRGDAAAVHVTDQGSGVPAQDRDRIFDKFERLGRSGDGGSGLGLYISRKLARAMDGELTVSDAPEGGALFTLSLPPR
jgi:Histidine kinase-, DNA gyrase B-, and HSP90-like ATPase/His Kinase A (phospho-acceptor) domain